MEVRITIAEMQIKSVNPNATPADIGSMDPPEPVIEGFTPSSSSTNQPEISPSSAVQAVEQQSANTLLRRPQGSTQGGGAATTGAGNGSNVTAATLPAQSVQMPTEVINTGSQVSGKDASPLPSFSSGNSSMQFYENYAASMFELQLV